jgi:ribosomal protein S18 acetylase RimI-like enzyme
MRLRPPTRDDAPRGIGSWLPKAVFARCRSAGLRQAMLGVASDNPRAAELYERAGMRVHRRLSAYERLCPPAQPAG